MNRRACVPAVTLLLLNVGLVPPVAASEIPAFARKYRVSCSLCHNPVPTLTDFGETFAGNGFRFAPQEEPRDTIGTGDDLLQLMREVPLAFRLDAYVQAYTGGDFATDLQTPYNLKILSGGTISKKLSYYLYFFLYERGEIGGIEDAFVQLNDLNGAPVDLVAGQFQVSDPMFKRELRLEFQDYAVYRARVGLQPADLTYDRGLMVVADAGGFTITGEVVNGNGRGEAEPNRRLDNDVFKSLFGHVSHELDENLRVGAMGYWGKQEGAADPGDSEVTNRVWMVGVDATITAGQVELNAQYIHREDNAPTFDAFEETAITNGGFVEFILRPPESRWYLLGLYNLVHNDRNLLNPRLGGPSNVERYEAVTAGVGYLARRNFRLLGEFTWDMEQDQTRWTLGLMTAF